MASLLRCTPKNSPGLVLRRDVALPLYDLTVSNILNYMFYTKFGNVCLLQEDSLVGIISLRDIVRYAYSQLIDTGVKTGEVASRAVIQVSRDSTLLDVIDLMLTRGVRRVIFEDGGEKRVINDMGVIQYTFSSESLAAMRDSPEKFFSMPVEELPMVEAGVAEIGMDVSETWREIYRSPAGCLFVENTNMILTPWDAVIKPFLLGKLPIDAS
ncbi:MAG: CBS domain-containing protein [Aigarchaeota archaeon]|nr:CBS domain-containing protein [Candidatus Pelearchaeum maunauluense]